MTKIKSEIRRPASASDKSGAAHPPPRPRQRPPRRSPDRTGAGGLAALDWPDDPSPEEIRRQAAPELQELLDNPDPRFAKLKAQFVASLADAADALEERLAKVIDAHARRSRETFRVVDGGRR